jgi:hypothetical protein
LIAGKKEGEDIFPHITRKNPASPRNKRLKNKTEAKIRVLASQIRIQLGQTEIKRAEINFSKN